MPSTERCHSKGDKAHAALVGSNCLRLGCATMCRVISYGDGYFGVREKGRKPQLVFWRDFKRDYRIVNSG